MSKYEVFRRGNPDTPVVSGDNVDKVKEEAKRLYPNETLTLVIDNKSFCFLNHIPAGIGL